MKDLQEVYNRMQEKKKELREIKSVYRDVLANSKEYQEMNKNLQKLRDQKKQMEERTKNESNDFKAMEGLQVAISNDANMLSNIAIARLTKGEPIKVVDEKNNEYEPNFSVKFKKIV